MTLLSVGAASPARAQIEDTFDDNPPVPDYKGSPRHFALEIKFGQYSPNLDSTPGLTGLPFAELFNNQYSTNKDSRPTRQLLTTLEFDWQFWRPFGSFGLAGSIGYQGRVTHSFQYPLQPITNPNSVICDANGNCICSTITSSCIRSSDTTQLNVIPLTLELVYRFDVLAERYHVPIVPYLKGGLGYYAWFIQSGNGGISKSLDGTSSAYGGTLGLVAHPGVAVLLDFLDPAAARTFDGEIGVNHTYLFVELNYAWITGLGFKDKWVFSDTTWNAGLAFEF